MRAKAHNFSTWVPHLFLFYKEKVFRKLVPIMVAVIAYALIIFYFDVVSVRFEKISSYNLGQFHLIFSFIITILVSFRVNTTYARWWEGRVLWGSIVNNCRNLGLKFETYSGLKTHPEFMQLLAKLPLIIKLNLRVEREAISEIFLEMGISELPNHPVLEIIRRMYQIINQQRDDNLIRWEQYTAMDNHLVNLLDMLGGCERIANTPVPPAFAFFVKQALLFYTLIFPFGWVYTFGVLIIPMMVMIVYLLLGLEILSEELEDPFGIDDNDLPLDKITKTIAKNIEQIAAN